MTKAKPKYLFLKRLTRNFLFAMFIINAALWGGMYGYHYFEKLSWTDSFLNASMILSGMGPVNDLHTQGGKIFSGMYALFSGTLFLVIIAIVFAPVIHWCFNQFHLAVDGK